MPLFNFTLQDVSSGPRPDPEPPPAHPSPKVHGPRRLKPVLLQPEWRDPFNANPNPQQAAATEGLRRRIEPVRMYCAHFTVCRPPGPPPRMAVEAEEMFFKAW